MTFLMRIRQYRVYRRLVLSYILLLILSITIVSTVLYTLFSSRAVKEIDNSSKQMLSQGNYTANEVSTQIHNVMSQLLTDGSVNSFLNETDTNKVTNYEAYLVISKMQKITPFIADISLYNFVNGQYVDTSGFPRDPQVASPEQKQFIGFYPRKVQKNSDNEVLQLLTFRIVPEWQTVTNAPKSALVLDLDDSYIRRTIESINLSAHNGDTFVIDGSGQVLSHSNPQFFMADFTQMDYVQRILHAKEDSGSFVQTINHQNNLVTYVRSNTLDWYFITVRPYNELLSDIYMLRNWTWVIALILILLGTVISLIITGNLHNPIRTLVDRVLEIQGNKIGQKSMLNKDEYALLLSAFMNTIESADRSKHLLKRSSILSVLKGIDNYTFTQIAEEWSETLKGPFFKVLLFKVDNMQSFKKNYAFFERELIQFAIGNIAQEILCKEYSNDIAVTEQEIIVILQSERKGRHDELYFMISEIQDAIHKFYKITVSASIGDWCDTIVDLKNSYQSAEEYINYRLFFGANCIVDSERTIHDQDLEIFYSSTMEREFTDAVKLCNEKMIQQQIGKWISYISRSTYTQAIQYTSLLLLTMIKEFESIIAGREIKTNELYACFRRMQHVETLDDIREILLDFCVLFKLELEENHQMVSAMKSAKVIEKVKQLIVENYGVSDLSLEFAAYKVGLSAGYLGKLFKSHVLKSFNDYVMLVRIDHAKRLLVETNETVAEIGARVGIPGAGYFSTVFKKNVGMSPTQYRESLIYNQQ